MEIVTPQKTTLTTVICHKSCKQSPLRDIYSTQYNANRFLLPQVLNLKKGQNQANYPLKSLKIETQKPSFNTFHPHFERRYGFQIFSLPHPTPYSFCKNQPPLLQK